MNASWEFDHTLLGELIARRWQEDPGYYALNRNADHRWLEGSWRCRTDHAGVELHWTRQSGPQPGAALPAAN